MAICADATLLEGMNRVLTRFLEHRYWHCGMSICVLRGGLNGGHMPAIIHESANPQHLKGILIALPDWKWASLVDRLELEQKFPTARRE